MYKADVNAMPRTSLPELFILILRSYSVPQAAHVLWKGVPEHIIYYHPRGHRREVITGTDSVHGNFSLIALVERKYWPMAKVLERRALSLW